MREKGERGELPKGWVWTRLEQCVDILDGRRVPVNSEERQRRTRGKMPSELYPYYGAAGQVGLIDGYLFDGEILLVGEDGAPFLDSSKPKAYLVRGKSWVNNHAHVLRALGGIPNAYLCSYLNVFDYHNYVTGTTRLKLNQAQMRRIPVPIAPLEEQQRIVAKIEGLITQLDAGVEALLKVKAQIKRYRQAVLKAAFEGKLTEAWRERHGHEPETAQMWPQRPGAARSSQSRDASLDISVLPELPKGWTWSTVGAIGEVSGGLTKNSKRAKLPRKMPYLRVANVYAAELRLDEVKTIGVQEQEVERALLRPGDLLVVEGNGSRDQIGRVAIWDGSIDPCLHQNHIIKVRFTPAEVAKFALLWLLSDGGRDQITQVASSTSGLYTLSISKVGSLPMPVAPLPEQREIVAEVERRFSVADQLETAVEQGLKRAERLRQSILKRAFEGKLVPQDPADEPAAVLLERIRAERGIRSTKHAKRREGREGGRQGRRRRADVRQERLL